MGDQPIIIAEVSETPQEVLQSAQEPGHVSDEDLASRIGSDLDSQMDIDLDYVDEGPGPDTSTNSDRIAIETLSLQKMKRMRSPCDEDLNSRICSDLDSQMDIDLDYVDEGPGPDTTTVSDRIATETPVSTDEEAHEIALSKLRTLRREKERALVYAELKLLRDQKTRGFIEEPAGVQSAKRQKLMV